MHAWNSIRVQNRVRLGHFAKPGTYEDNPSVPLDHSRPSPDVIRHGLALNVIPRT